MQVRFWIIFVATWITCESFAAETSCIETFSAIGKNLPRKGPFQVPGSKRMHVVNDLDGNIVHLWHSGVGPPPATPKGFQAYTITHMAGDQAVTETYIVADSTLRVLGEMQGRAKAKGVDLHMSFFSGGLAERNEKLLKAIVVSDGAGKKTSLYDLSRGPDGRARVLSRDDILFVRERLDEGKLPKGFHPVSSQFLDPSRVSQLDPFDGALMVKDMEKFDFGLDETVLLDDHMFFSGIKDQSGNLIRSVAKKGRPEETAADWEQRMGSLLDHAIENRRQGKDIREGLAQRQFRVERGTDGKPKLIFDPLRYDAKNRNVPGSMPESAAAPRVTPSWSASEDIRLLARKHKVWAATDEADLVVLNERLADRWQPHMTLSEFRANMYESFVINRVLKAGNSASGRTALLAEDAAGLPLLSHVSRAARDRGFEDGITAARKAIAEAGSTGRVLEVDPKQAQIARDAFRDAYVKATKGRGTNLTALQKEADRLAELCLAGGACAADIVLSADGPGVAAIRDAPEASTVRGK